MKKILTKIFGKETAEKPVAKVMVFAVLGTVAALILAILVLIFSSIGFAIADNMASNSNTDSGSGDKDNDGTTGGGTTTVQVQYEDATIDDVKSKLDGKTNLAAKDRVISGTNYYYSTIPGGFELSKGAADSVDEMLKGFYIYKEKSNKPLVTETKAGDGTSNNPNCNIPHVNTSKKDGYAFVISTFNDIDINDNAEYEWIFKYAYKYGFIYEGNTFTYVGKAAATYMNNKNISYDNFITKLKGSSVPVDKMYYIAKDATEIKLPSNYDYTVIPDGDAGYIVTITTKK